MTSARGKITIIGAGLNGPLLALLLKQRRFDIEIYERRPDMRHVSMSAGRSINLAVSTRGIHALKKAGVWDQMQPIIIPMRGRMMHSVSGELTFQPYGKNETEVINSTSRAALNITLLNAAEKFGVTIHFNQRCVGCDPSTGAIFLRNEETSDITTHPTEVVIGCDGSASSIRTAMAQTSHFSLSESQLDYGYKELTIPASANGKHLMESHALHIWPRGSLMLIALPNIDGTFACILFLPFEGAGGFATISTKSDVLSFFEGRFPDALRLMPDLASNYFANPTGSMVTVKCSPWHMEGKVLLLGDSAHAIVPFFGQGINCGFEDCTSLMELVDRHGADWARVFSEFEKMRKLDTDAIADMAIENFIEMRDRVGDPRFLFRKKVELALEARYPEIFVPKYAMVTFHRIPYSVAMQRGAIQDRLLSELCDSIDRVENLDWQKADHLIHRDLTPLEIAE
jgi:kynurenine 3-monooxygenase